MFAIEKSCKVIREAIAELESSNEFTPTTSDMKALVSMRELVVSSCDQLLSEYENSDEWKDEGFLSAQQTITHLTGCLPGSARKSLMKGKFLNQNPALKKAIDDGAISYDHLTPLVPLVEERYQQFFDDDAAKLIEMAELMPAAQFSRAITQWKYFVDEVIENDDETRRYEQRFLHIYESELGYWKIEGKLDPISGSIVKKALEDIRSQLWRADQEAKSNESLNGQDDDYLDDYTAEMQRADAIGYLAQGYVAESIAASTPAGQNHQHKPWFGYKVADPNTIHNKSFHFSDTSTLVADIVIDINDLKPKKSTRPFIEKCLTEFSPLISTHSRSYVEQLLCDCALDAPIKHNDGTYDLGRSVRTAPAKLKRQLLLGQNTCSIKGCSTPAKWCDAHHIEHWAHGGKTSLGNLALICRRHHSMIHHDKRFAERTIPKLKQKPMPMARTG